MATALTTHRPSRPSKLATLNKKPLGTGMDFAEVTNRFIRSRERGTGGAKLQASDSTVSNYRYDLGRFFDTMKERYGLGRYEQITRDHVDAYVDLVQGSELSKSSKNHIWRSLRVFFRWVAQDPECKAMKLESHAETLPVITANDSRMYLPSPEVMQDFLETFDKKHFDGLRSYTALALMLDTGARVGEVCNLELSDIKWDIGMVRLDGKTGERFVPFNTDKLGPILRRYLAEREHKVVEGSKGENKVFITRYSNLCTPNTFDQVFARHRKATGLGTAAEGNLSPHTVRHYFCTMYLVHGGTIHALKRITGHESVTTLEKYLHMANQLGFVAEEHARVSPLANLKGGDLGKKKRKMR